MGADAETTFVLQYAEGWLLYVAVGGGYPMLSVMASLWPGPRRYRGESG